MTRRRNWGAAVCAVAWLIVGVRYAHMLPKLPSRATEYDFSLYYTSVRALSAGLDPYRADLVRLGGRLGCKIEFAFRCNYTPPFVASMEPLGRMPIRTAFWLWQALSAGALGAALLILFAGSGLGAAPALTTAAAILIFPPTTVHIKYSQSQFVILLMLVAALKWIRSGREESAGIALAAATLFKAYPLVMAGYLVAKRKWKALGWMAGGVGAGAALTCLALGPHTWIEFALNNGADPFFANPDNIALAAFITRVYRHVFTSTGSDLIRHGVIAAIQLLVVAIAFATTVSGDDREGCDYSVWVVAMLLVTPLVWLHYLPLLAIPLIQMVAAAYGGRVRRRTLAAMAIAYALASASWPLGWMTPEHGAAELLSEFGAFALVAAYAAVVGMARDVRRAADKAGQEMAAAGSALRPQTSR